MRQALDQTRRAMPSTRSLADSHALPVGGAVDHRHSPGSGYKRSLTVLFRHVCLDLCWSLRAPQNILYEFFVSAVLLFMLAQINDSAEYVSILVPGVIALATASSAMQGIGIPMSYMRVYGAWRTVESSPIPTWLYLMGMTVSRLLRLCVTVGFVLIFASGLFDYHAPANLALTYLLVTIGFVTFAALGLVISYLMRSPQGVTGVLNGVFFLMIFTSNALFVSEAVWMQAISLVSPLTFVASLLRYSLNGGAFGAAHLMDFAALTTWLLVTCYATYRLSRKSME